MATTIDTTPSSGVAFGDTSIADTITLSDGPATNGFQTSELTTSVNNALTPYIFANKATFVIDGGNKGDTVILDNPNPATGLQSLVIQNLGAGSTIDGGSANANSPDITVGMLTMSAAGNIGVTRALQTQVSTLFAAAGIAGVAGNINIANGVAAPITLNIGALQATNAAGGTITLTNNGTINLIQNGGITATGSIAIGATGATADFNTGSGGGVTSNTGSITNLTTIGEDTNLGDGVGGGSMSAATGITWSTGRNFTINANATVTNTTSGNITITAGGDFTMLTSPGSLANAPEIVNNASGGSIMLQAGSGQTLTVDSTGTTAIQSSNGAITLIADAMFINRLVDSGTAATTLAPATAGQAISIGGNDTAGVLGLTQAELNEVTAAVLRVGAAGAGNITIVAPVTESSANTLSLINNGSISEGAFGSLHAANLRVSSIGPVTLNSVNNGVSNIAASITGAFTLSDGPNPLIIGTVDGVTGITTNNSAINLTTDNINITQAVNAGTSIVTVAPSTASQTVALGGADAAGTLGLADSELGQITASVLRVNSGLNAGITVAGTVTRHAGYNTLSLTTAQSINESAGLAVANLALTAGSAITLTNSANAVDTLAFANTSLSVSFTNGSNNGLTIGAVDGLTSSWNAGTTTTISTGRNLTFATGLSSAGATTLTSTIGRILDGTGGAIVDITAPSLALSASTGIGTSAGPLLTQVGTLSAVTSTGRIFINNDRAVPGTLNIGSGGLRVTGASGDIVLRNNGTINVLTTNNVIVGPGNISVQAHGANADINTGGQNSQLAIRSHGLGFVNVVAGRDITLGNVAGFGDVRSDSGSVVVSAGRNITINSNTFIDVGSGTGTVAVAAGGNLTMTSAQPDEIFTAGGDVALSTGAGATMTLATSGATAVTSNGGNISLTADTLNISQGVNAGTGNVAIQPVTAGQLISLGTATGGLNLTSTELNLVTATNLTIGNANAGAVTLGGTVKPTKVTNLVITTGGNFTATAGSGLGATGGTVTINFGQNGHGATADLTNVAFSSTNFVIGGAGDDTFIPNPSTISTFTGGAGDDTFRGTGSQLTLDTITDISGGDRIVITDGNLAHFSFSLNGTTLSFNPDTSVSPAFDTLHLSNRPNGHFIASADPVAGVDLTYIGSPIVDFNTDGLADEIFQTPDNRFLVGLSQGTSFTAPSQWVQHGGSFIPGQAQYADVDSDGRADLIMQGNDNSFYVSLSTGSNFTPPVLWIQHGGSFIPGQAQYADVNGDGRADLILQSSDNGFYTSLSTGVGFTAPALWVQHGGTFTAGEAQYADINGDGRADLILQTGDNRFFVSTSTGNGFTGPIQWMQHGGTFTPGQAQYADVNGDGLADLIFQSNDNRFFVSTSTGSSFSAPVQWVQQGGTFLAGEAQYADVNGDHLADLIFQGIDNRFFVSLSNGTSFTAPAEWGALSGSFTAGQAQYADVNGDGKADLLFQANDNKVYLSLSSGANFGAASVVADFGAYGAFQPGTLHV